MELKHFVEKRKRFFSFLAMVIGGVAVLAVLWIMAKGFGLVDGLEFGSGSYYYADIPEYDKYMHDGAFYTSLPFWIYVLLFILWGVVMYWLWVWLERRNR